MPSPPPRRSRDASSPYQRPVPVAESPSRPEARRFGRTLALCATALALCLATPASHATADTPAPAMLAERYTDAIDPAAYWVSEKLDGVRALWDGQRLRFRSGREIVAPAWFLAALPATAVDGELWIGRRRFDELSGLIRREDPQDPAWRAVRYMLFDQPGGTGDFSARLHTLRAIVTAAAVPWLQTIPQRRVPDRAALQRLLEQTVAGGGEGLMLHRGASLYRAGRGDDLLKLKTHDDAEARVIAHVPGKGKHAGRLGALMVETPEGRRFALGTGFTDAQRADPPPVGSWVTYRFRGLHEGSGLPRFASFLRVRSDEARFRSAPR